MKYAELDGLKTPVSRFGMGCMRLPRAITADGGDTIDEQESIRMIRRAVDAGVNYFDTAYTYPGSEELLGKALAGGYRDRVLVATKCPVWESKSHLDYARLLDEQLARLSTDHIDVYLFHCLDGANWEKVKAAGGIEFVQEMKHIGKIRQFGFSFHADYELFTEIVDACHWDVCLLQLNILDGDHQAGVRGMKYAAGKGISVVVMEPLKGGLLGGKAPEEVQALLGSYPERRSLVEWAFRWLYHFPEVKVVLSGVSNMEQLEDNLRIADAAETGAMSDGDMALMNRVKAVYNQKVRVGCTGCGYCMPCPAGVNIPEIFKVYNDEALSPWSEFGKTFYGLVASHSGRDASRCVECGQCMEHCPQKIRIPEVLKEAHALMKS
jgi:predicted aldo/keto reductase-like oxidoreductase